MYLEREVEESRWDGRKVAEKKVFREVDGWKCKRKEVGKEANVMRGVRMEMGR